MTLDTFLLIGLVCILSIVLLVLIFISILVKKKGIVTEATITNIEEVFKYKDSSMSKHLAYDYFYEYIDFNGNKQTGRLMRNSSQKEFDVGDTIEVKYISYWPKISIESRLYNSLSFLPYIVVLMIMVISCIIWVKLG